MNEPRPNKPPVVAVAIYDGLCTFEFGCVVEVFGLPRPELREPLYELRVCMIERGPLRGSGGVRISAEYGLKDLDDADTIVIPGWRDVETAPPAAFLAAIRRAHARGARIATVCSGSAVLAHAGLLNGRRATTHWRYADRFRRLFPEIEIDENVLYIDDGQLVTSAGSAAGLDMCLHLVRSDYGEAIANTVARRLVIPPHRDGNQAQFIERPLAPRDRSNRLAELLDQFRSRLTDPLTVDRMASAAGMSERSFLRHFRKLTGTSPAKWLTAERLRYACELLETTDLGFSRVAHVSGLGSEGNLRHQFRRQLNVSPGTYRRTFRGAPGGHASRQTS